MSKPVKTYLAITVLYTAMYFGGLGYWSLIAAPTMAAVVMLILLFSPHFHRWVYGDSFYKIKEAQLPKETQGDKTL